MMINESFNNKLETKDAILAHKVGGKSIFEILTELKMIVGENIKITNIKKLYLNRPGILDG